jgi:tRNA1Val (adenine37-N6)-methyltransferase
MFHFKQFSIDQSGCAMKINTDGVLLGALAEANDPENILDIGAGTGVIALMLAQRFNNARIDAVEIDAMAAQTAGRNFVNSPFANRLNIFPSDFESFFKQHPERKYDLIVSNPPFHINSLESPGDKKSLAKHTNARFFERLINKMANHLSANGSCWLILPLQTAELVKGLSVQYEFYIQKIIAVHSYIESDPHREILVFGRYKKAIQKEQFVIYEGQGKYSEEYQKTLKDFFTIF